MPGVYIPPAQSVVGDLLDAGALASHLNLTPTDPAENGLTLQRPDDDTWGVGQVYGAGQFFELLRKDFPPVGSGVAGAIVDPDDLVLFRIDRTGGFGTSGGVHVATGLRQDAGFDPDGVALWIDPSMDVIPLVINSKREVGFAQTADLLSIGDGTVSPQYTVFRITAAGRAKARAGLDLEVRNVADANLTISAIAGQTEANLRVNRTNGTKALTFEGAAQFAAYADNGSTQVALIAAGSTPAFGARMILQASSAATIVAFLQGAASQTGDLTRWVNRANATLSRIDKNGYFVTKKNTAPADADLAAGEMAVWFDQTNGAAKFMVKAKQADGTVRTGNVALA